MLNQFLWRKNTRAWLFNLFVFGFLTIFNVGFLSSLGTSFRPRTVKLHTNSCQFRNLRIHDINTDSRKFAFQKQKINAVFRKKRHEKSRVKFNYVNHLCCINKTFLKFLDSLFHTKKIHFFYSLESQKLMYHLITRVYEIYALERKTAL